MPHDTPIPKTLTIAITGNPNCGKTTLFNALTGSNQRVGNWPGVTVERVEGILQEQNFRGVLIDLPGIYTLVPDSEDEVVARHYLATGSYDLVIDVVDASNPERNLYLTTQLIEMGIPLIVLLNKMDLAAQQGISIDTTGLGQVLGVPVFATNAHDIRKVREFLAGLSDLLSLGIPAPGATLVRYPEPIEQFITGDGASARDGASAGTSPGDGASAGTSPGDGASLTTPAPISRRSILLSFIEEDPVITNLVRTAAPELFQTLAEEAAHIRREMEQTPTAGDADMAIAEARYAAIRTLQPYMTHARPHARDTRGAAATTTAPGSASASASRSGSPEPGRSSRKKRQLDDIVLHRFLGVPIFFGVMYLVFWVTLSLGGAWIDFFDILFGAIFVEGFGNLLHAAHAPTWLTTFLANGLGGGIQTISTFVPIIFCMFLMLSILEDSGYMARAAFVMDRFMRFIGLPGKAFVPMLVGFGCTVPAILATRTLENRRDRFLTIFMVPFMSCGARLPVYALFAATFFDRYAGIIVFSIYLAGVLLAVVTGLLLKRTLFRGEFSPFIMEFPAYQLPRFAKIMRSTLLRLRLFVVRAGKVILLAVVILTVLNSLGVDGTFGNEDTESSVLSAVGKSITPIFTPMGIRQENWPATVGLFTGIFAKESIIGTLTSLYGVAENPQAAAETTGDPAAQGDAVLPGVGLFLWDAVVQAFTALGQNLAEVVIGANVAVGGTAGGDGGGTGGTEEATLSSTDAGMFQILQSRFTAAGAYAYMLFVLIYFPCVATLGAAFREAGRFYGSVLVVYLTSLAWVISVLFYQLAEGRDAGWIAIALVVFGIIYLSLSALGRAGRRDRGLLEAKAFL